MRKHTLWVTISALAIFAGCARSNIQYGDAGAVETVTTDFGSTDLQLIAERMVDSLVTDPYLPKDRPLLYVARVKNKTDELVDTKNITDKIRTALIRSRKFRFTAAMEMNEELVKQIEYQENSGNVDQATAKRFGRQLGADYFLYGELTNIAKRTKRVDDIYMKFNLNLVNIETGEIEWADEKEIRKTEKRGVFGR